jgi:hypothetical protein
MMAERFYHRSLAIKQDRRTWILLSSALDRLRQNDEAEKYLCKSYEHFWKTIQETGIAGAER